MDRYRNNVYTCLDSVNTESRIYTNVMFVNQFGAKGSKTHNNPIRPYRQSYRKLETEDRKKEKKKNEHEREVN